MSFVEIKLDKSRNFKYGMRALDRIEKKLKKKMGQIDLNNLSMEETAVVMWAGLVHEDKDLSPDRVMTLVDDHSNFTDAIRTMGEALEMAFGSGEEEEKNE